MGRRRIYEDPGKLTLRLPDEHKEAARKAADADRRSLNFWIAEAVEQRLIREGLIPDPKKKGGSK
jgi:predicted HicB family RNase H-like nuclease